MSWQPISTAPKDGKCILAVATDFGYEIAILERQYSDGTWMYEGEPVFCRSCYYEPQFWMPLPDPPVANTNDKSE